MNDYSDVAVLVPCYNEAAAIGSVVRDFSAHLPGATIYVYDNNSSDGTGDVARAAGALVRCEKLQGKGHVVRRMFSDVEARVYVLVDGDATYDAASAPAMVAMLRDERLDMVNGTRVSAAETAYRRGHVLGNRLLSGLVARIFGDRLHDLLSGYRVLSRRFVKSFPALAAGFETETELTVHALELSMPIAEIETPYRERPPGSTSKLSTYRDGLRILRTIVMLAKQERPFAFFGVIALLFAAAGLVLALPVIVHFLHTGLVPRLPTALLSTGLEVVACLSFGCGLVLDTVSRARLETKRLFYLLHSIETR